MSTGIEQIRRDFGGIIRENEPMRAHTTFRVGGPAEIFASPDREQLEGLMREAKRLGCPVTVIGNGSNLLVSDEGIKGLVLEIGRNMSRIEVEGSCLRIGAGALLSQAASTAAACGLSGMEFAAGIPGSLGGAVVMNAGAYGGEMKDILREVTVLTPEGEELILPPEELALSYRHSIIPERGYIVTEAVVELIKKPQEEIRALMAELRRKRLDKQPLEYASAGSTFKRPEGYFAGKLIEDAGLRGFCVGDAQVSEKHCGFVINRGNATATEILQLIRQVQKKVKEKFQVELEPEVRLLGFADSAGGDGI